MVKEIRQPGCVGHINSYCYIIGILQNSFSGGKRKGSLRLSKKLPFFKVKEGSPDEEKEGKAVL